MKFIPVFAVADSRLHADVMLIRLRRADIPCNDISAFFPRRSIPNAVACWLRLNQNLSLKIGHEVFATAGRPPSLTKSSAKKFTAIAEVFSAAGIDSMSAHRLEEKLDQGHTLLCVWARDEAEASIAWQVFKTAGAETIVVSDDALPALLAAVKNTPATGPVWAVAA
jgi:hypothetical protein